MKTTKKHQSFLEQRKETLKLYPDQRHELVNRRTGKTLSLALAAISQAMLNRNKTIKIVSCIDGKFNEIADHTGSVSGKRTLFNYIIETIDKLGLEGFIIDKKDHTITYKLETVDFKLN